ncbi:MAG: hypothetical protein ABH828_02625 [archaeon]
MGLFGNKNKKREENSGIELNQDPEKLKKDLLGSKDDIPSLENIPLPPKDDLDLPIPAPDETSFKEPEYNQKQEDDFTAPMEPNDLEEKTIEEPPVKSKPSMKTGITDNSDFSLPDFTEEEIETEEKVEELEQTEKENYTKTAPAAEVKPIMKTTSEKKKTKQYLDVNNCRIIFEKINSSEDILRTTREDILTHYGKNKSQLQNYKNFHDTLDKVQEKLMEIDSSLFER